MNLRDFVSVASLLVSIFALILTNRIRKRQADLQEEQLRVQSILAKYKVAEDAEKRAAKTRAILNVELHKGEPSEIVITNDGGAPARDVSIRIELRDKQLPPWVENDFDSKIPIKEMLPGGVCPLMAVFTGGGRYPPYDVVVTWVDPDGTAQRLAKTIYA